MNNQNKKITIWLIFVLALSLLAVVAFVNKNSRQILLNKAAETTKKDSNLIDDKNNEVLGKVERITVNIIQ